MYNIKNFSIVSLLLLLSIGCKDHQLSPIENDGIAPGPVTNALVENLPGKAIISYDLPDDTDLLYVKAVYEINQQGTVRESKSAFYNNSLTVDGFATTDEYEVKLYAVDRGENASESLSVTVQPLTPPILSVFESLQVKEDFGGINVTFINEAEAEVVIAVMTQDSLGEWISADNLYTARASGNFSVRGYPAEEREFALYVRDRWDNHSDTLIQTILPIYEIELDKERFDEHRLPSDRNTLGSWPVRGIFDGIIGNQGLHTSQNADQVGFPQWVTIDLGVTARLSRFTFWDRGAGGDSWIYTHGNVKTMELWGSTDPNPDGSFDGWTYLMTVESFKPSGLPAGNANSEDAAYAAAGQEFNFPATIPAVRYIRFKVLESWTAPLNSPNGFFHMSEVSFWGQDQEE